MNIIYFGDLKGGFLMISNVYFTVFNSNVLNFNDDFKHSFYITLYHASIFRNGIISRFFLV
jgi:hypothetical protein